MQSTGEKIHILSTLPDPRADEKAYWVQAKRAVLAILRVQPAKDLVESLKAEETLFKAASLSPPVAAAWPDIIDIMVREKVRQK